MADKIEIPLSMQRRWLWQLYYCNKCASMQENRSLSIFQYLLTVVQACDIFAY